MKNRYTDFSNSRNIIYVQSQGYAVMLMPGESVILSENFARDPS